MQTRLDQYRSEAYARLLNRARAGLLLSNVWTDMNDRLNNRAFSMPSDGWIHIAPYGNHPHPQKLVQVIDQKAAQSMVQNFHLQKSDPNFPGLLVDYDHKSQSAMTNTGTEAAGWISDLQVRNNGLWAKVDWTDNGERAISGGRFRMVSPVWRRSDCESMKNNHVRPLKLDSLAITNEPNMRGLTPITK